MFKVCTDLINAIREISQELKAMRNDLILFMSEDEEPAPNGNGEPTVEGKYKWVVNKYGDVPFPYDTVNNPHGNKLAIFEVIEKDAVVFTPEPTQTAELGKPVFTVNSGIKKFKGERVFAYRKILSGIECDAQPHIVVLDPAGGGMMQWKMKLVGTINENGNLE